MPATRNNVFQIESAGKALKPLQEHGSDITVLIAGKRLILFGWNAEAIQGRRML